MLKKTIKYTDFNGEKRVEDCYFNLNKAELMELQLGTKGGLVEWLKAVIQTKDTPMLSKLFKEMILKSYGIKDADGRRFRKSEEISPEFSQTGAYEALFMELIESSDAMAKFVNGIVPDDMNVTDDQVQKALKENNLV